MGILDKIFGNRDLSGEELRLLQALGIYDCASEKNCDFKKPVEKVYVEDETKAFKNLKDMCGLHARRFSSDISYREMECLKEAPRSNVLMLLENDTIYATLLVHETTIKFGKTRVMGKAGRVLVSEKDQRRMVAYVQMALNEIYKDEIKGGWMKPLSVNGNFDTALKKRLHLFLHQNIHCPYLPSGMGDEIGIGDLRLIAFHLRHTKQVVINKIVQAERRFRDYFWFTTHQKGDNRKVQEAVKTALEYLGLIPIGMNLDNADHRDMIHRVIRDNFKEKPTDISGPNVVGPVLLERIIKRVESKPMFVESPD